MQGLISSANLSDKVETLNSGGLCFVSKKKEGTSAWACPMTAPYSLYRHAYIWSLLLTLHNTFTPITAQIDQQKNNSPVLIPDTLKGFFFFR